MKSQHISIYLLFFLFSYFTNRSQNVDSLLYIFNKESLPDTTRLNSINEVCWNYYFEKPDSTIYYAQKSLGFARRSQLSKYELKALNFLGSAYNNLGENTKAIEYYS